MQSSLKEGLDQSQSIIAVGSTAIADAASCLECLSIELPETFATLVERIAESQAPVLIAGVGKSRIIAEKISASLASIGVTSFPLCALEAHHGDLGRVRGASILIALSSSGETVELIEVARYAREQDVFLASITRHGDSTLAQLSHIPLLIGSHPEAAPHGIIPTTSTTAMLAIGDAIAMSLMWYLQTPIDALGRLHPGGSIGAKLSKKVKLERD